MRTDLRRNGVLGACGLGLLLFLLLLLGRAPAARAEDAAAEGQCLAVRSPITSEEVNRLKEVCNSVLAAAHDRRNVVLVFDFNPDKASASTAEFGPCADLAQNLLDLPDVMTVAFVHGEVTRHSVLPVLACKERVLAGEGRLGPVLDNDSPPLLEYQAAAYEAVANRRHLSRALVAKLYDKDVEVLEGTRKDGSLCYVAKGRPEPGVVVNGPEPKFGKGRLAYVARQAQDFGLCVPRTMESLQEVVQAYNLPPTALHEDGLLGRNPVAWRTTVSGAVTGALVESLKRQIRRAVGNPEGHANLVILQLECGGGDPAEAQGLAEYLRGLKDDSGGRPVKTVAFVKGSATGTAAIVALGCSEIVLQKDATLGDLSVVAQRDGRGNAAPADEERDGLLLKQITTFAEKQGYSRALLRAMAYPNLPLYAVESASGPRRFALLTEAQRDADAKEKTPQWKNPQLVQSAGPAGKPLILDAARAEEVRLSRYTVDDVAALYKTYGVKGEQVRSGGKDWLYEFRYLLQTPGMSIFLILLGGTCLILELKMPGLGLPGVVAALCFVLFFWAHASSAGITLLAVLLFVLGLVLIGLEIFMLPGSAVFGISGVVLVVGSLALVAIEKWPQTTHEWVDLGGWMATFTISLGVAVVAAMLLAWYLPHIPYVKGLILKPPGEATDEEGVAEAAAPSPLGHPDPAALLGAIGVAATPLRPAGKVKFGDDYVDVVAEGSYVPPGNRVQVIEIEGYRIVVKEV
jgi:membrane-bound ClpP family serine protease